MADTAVPMKRNLILISVNETNQRNKNYLFYISEEYKIIIDSPEFYSMDLKPIISNFISPISNIKSLYCNKLSVVITEKLYAVPCRMQSKAFMIWIKFSRDKKVFKLDVFAQLTKHILIDDSFKNSIDFFKLGDSFYAISGTNSKGDKLAITYLDFSKIDSDLVIERLIKIFTHNDFNKKEFGLDLKPFNIRDILIYDKHTNDDKPYNGYINFMVSCYSNGLMFFQINPVNYSLGREDEQEIDISFSDVEEVTSGGVGRIAIVNNVISNTSDFTIVLSSSVPPIIYEIIIYDYNPIMHKQLAIKGKYSICHFYGEDVLAATDKYIATLVYDRKAWQFCVVIINRKDYSNSFGHSIIPLNDHVNRLSGMLFICTVGCNTLFIKNSKGSQTFEINPIDFVINTGTNHHDEYDNIKGKVLHIDIKTFNKFFDDDEMHFHVHVIAVNDNDTTPYYMEHDRSKSIFYSYGDKLFYHIISDSFSGPNLRFELIASNSSATDNLLLPNITEAFNASEDPKDIDLEGSCNKIFFHTYIDSHTLEESMMFYCVKRDQIEQYHFKIDYINSDKSGHIKSSLSDAHNK